MTIKNLEVTNLRRRRLRRAAFLALRVGATLFFIPAAGSGQQPPDLGKRFARTEPLIAMRDAVRLNTAVYVPKNLCADLPFILLRTPYGIDKGAQNPFKHYFNDLHKAADIFVFQDIPASYHFERRSRLPLAPRDPND